MRALVAGGTGFVGSHLALALGDAGYEVRSFARRPPAIGHIPAVEYCVGDLGNVGDVRAAMEGVDIGVFAATTTTPGSASRDSAFDAATNVVNAVHFLEAAADAGVGRLAVISSGGTVYGVPQRLPIAESHPTEPISSYGVTKLAVEKYFAVYAAQSGAKMAVLRAGNAFGERQIPGTGQGAAGAFLAALLAGRPVEIWGDGSVVRDYVYAGDLAAACVAALEHDGEVPVEVWNVGSGAGLSLLELLAACAVATGRAPEIELRPARPFDVPAVVLDTTRISHDLGWRPTTSLETGLERQAAWLVAVAGETGAGVAR